MSRLRAGVPFEDYWQRREELQLDGLVVDLIAYFDLVQLKKTQREKDWLMVTRLVEEHYFRQQAPSSQDVQFWLSEMRSPELLIEVTERFPVEAASHTRPAVASALAHDPLAVEDALLAEERRERELDRQYWAPLRKELERMRHERRSLPQE